ncbi:1712_t:CDS:2 [Gigaspora margarita]|uniref:1712_t:CDS:1 n=1 Tax=Gigaspora margarita TaxID=4874 RepID=A0ABN7WBG1_GIGMA|nr:1712_t:CDS:2 [Gigaspora margarita]
MLLQISISLQAFYSLPGPIPIPLIGTFELLKTNPDLDAYLFKLAKIYGQDGIFELSIIGMRQIIITRAENVDKFITSSATLSDQDKNGVALNHTYNYWKFNRRIFSRAVRNVCHSNEISDDSIIIDAVTWLSGFTNDFISALFTGSRTFAIESHYRKLKKNKMTKEMMDSEHFADCIANFVNMIK